MSNTLNESAAIWTAACPGTSLKISLPRYGGGASAVRPRSLVLGGTAQRSGAMWICERFEAGVSGPLPRDLRVASSPRDEQRIQDEQRQGRTLFAHREGVNPSAPATAHMGAISIKGGMGPYPWRRPV